MKYVGSKNRLAKELAPIIQSYITDKTEWYIEPFVGGANMMDKINHDKRIGFDIQKNLIALLRYLQTGLQLPLTISEEEYLLVRDNKEGYPDWYVGLVGFCATFGAKYFGGYARGFKADKTTPRDMPNEAIRNLEKQRESLKGVLFRNKSFLELDPTKMENCVVYCDPPYRDTTEYATDSFPYGEFYDWCKEVAKNNTVLVSEYSMPDEFTCIWEKEHKTGLDVTEHKIRMERLFTI